MFISGLFSLFFVVLKCNLTKFEALILLFLNFFNAPSDKIKNKVKRFSNDKVKIHDLHVWLYNSIIKVEGWVLPNCACCQAVFFKVNGSTGRIKL